MDLARLGPRAATRAAPRAGIALAAAGCALVVYGALSIGGDSLAGDDGGGSQLPGIALTAAVVVAGFLVVARHRTGPLATAGAVAAALGVPPLVFFVTFSENSFPPYETNAILFLSTAAWAASYLAGPTKGRPFFLGAACVGLWLSILQAVEDVFDFPFVGIEAAFSGLPVDVPSPTTLGVISLAFGGGYLFLARRWDRDGLTGAATPVTAAALAALPVGVVFLADELDATGAGILGAAIGVAVALHGASVGRRGATWLGAAGAAAGLVAVVGDNVGSATGAGLALIGLGGLAVVGAEALRRATGESDEVEGPSPDAPIVF